MTCILPPVVVTLLLLLLVCFHPAAAQNPVYRARFKPLKATVRMIAVSSSVRQAYAGNQDTYFAEIVRAGKSTGNL